MTAAIPLAERLAADLAGAQVDPNEAQKALAYLRSVRDPQRFFEYLRAIDKDGRAVIRSNQTLSYYRELLAASKRYLDGLDAREMALTLGWAIRLLRYYKTVPQASPRQTPGQSRTIAPSQEQRAAVRESQPPPPPKATPELPEVGAVFRGKITEMDKTLAVIAVDGFTDTEAVALLYPDVADLRRYKVGNAAWVEVVGHKTHRSGRKLLIVKPAPKPQGGQG